MPSSELGSSPSKDIRRATSRALRPASTNTRVPLATNSTALPVEPLPRTLNFMVTQYQRRTIFTLIPSPFGRGLGEGLAKNKTHPRSEEHTSELQSRRDLVCRLLL